VIVSRICPLSGKMAPAQIIREPPAADAVLTDARLLDRSLLACAALPGKTKD
jgi:hypothetical protein